MKHQAVNLKARTAALLAAVREWNALKDLTEHEGFKVLATSVSGRIVASVNALCDTDCDEKKSSQLRAEIHALRWFLQIPKVKRDEIEKLAKAVEHLRPTVDRLQRVGLSAADPELKKLQKDVADQERYLNEIIQ